MQSIEEQIYDYIVTTLITNECFDIHYLVKSDQISKEEIYSEGTNANTLGIYVFFVYKNFNHPDLYILNDQKNQRIPVLHLVL